MIDQILEFGLIKLAIVAVVGLLVGICEAARKPVDQRWATVLQEPLSQRIWNRIRRRGSTSVEVRQDRS